MVRPSLHASRAVFSDGSHKTALPGLSDRLSRLRTSLVLDSRGGKLVSGSRIVMLAKHRISSIFETVFGATLRFGRKPFRRATRSQVHVVVLAFRRSAFPRLSFPQAGAPISFGVYRQKAEPRRASATGWASPHHLTARRRQPSQASASARIFSSPCRATSSGSS